MSVHFRSDAPTVTVAASAPTAQKRGKIALDYPGLPAEFVLEKDNWNSLGGADLMRSIVFKSTTSTSLIQEFDVQGWEDGSVKMHVRFGGGYCRAELNSFLINNDLTLAAFYCFARNEQEISDLFRIVFTHNTLPANMLGKVREIAMKCKCEPIPNYGLRLFLCPMPSNNDARRPYFASTDIEG